MQRSRLALLMLCSSACWAADTPPSWLKDLTAVSLPSYGPKVNTVVLLNEEQTAVSSSGSLVTTTRTAIKILDRKGGDVVFSEQYDNGGDKMRDFKAWNISPSGKVKKYAKDEIIDIACAPNDVYNECRRRAVSNKPDVESGAIFGYEATVERRSFASQLSFHFQGSSPVRLARFELTLPPDWSLQSSSFNGAPPETRSAAGSHTWQMENLPAIEPEAFGPSILTLAPWVGVNLTGVTATGTPSRSLTSWAQAARTLTELNDGQAEPDQAIISKAKSLVEGAQTDLDRIRAIGHFTQQVNYVSVQVNVTKGGGYKPHAATQVFQKLYGDCKDKANLTRAMLKAIGITAYPVAIFSGDRTHVSAAWPSLGVFNHAISAIRVDANTVAPAILDHPKLGRLLFFDSTDPYVPVGYIPGHEQGSLALIGAGGDGDLVRIPEGPAPASSRAREVTASLRPDGGISGTFIDTRTGEAQSIAIGTFRSSSKSDYVKMIERWVGRSVPGSSISDVNIADNAAGFVLSAKFESRQYAQHPQAGMLIFRAAMLHHGELRLSEKTRKQPVVLDADALSETVRVALPQEYKVDEIPPPQKLNSPFGSFEASWTSDAGTLVFRRKIEIPARTVPPEQYAELKKFLDTIAGTAELPVVLVK